MANPKNSSQKADGEAVEVRVIAHCTLGKIDDVVKVDAATLAQFSGDIDPNPGAVAYAKSLKKAS